jgi:hypothetical protein
METKQGYFEPKMGRPLDIRFYKATNAEILTIPVGARFEGMEIYAYGEDQWYQFKGGVADINLVISDRGGGSSSVEAKSYEWTWADGVDVGGTHLDFVIAGAIPNEIASIDSCILFVGGSVQQATTSFTIETSTETNDTVRIEGVAGEREPTVAVQLFYNREGVGIPSIAGNAPTTDDKNVPLLLTTSDGDWTGFELSNDPVGDVRAVVDQIYFARIGDAVKTEEAYWSRDGGTTALTLDEITLGDRLYWNGTIAGFELTAAMYGHLIYNTI